MQIRRDPNHHPTVEQFMTGLGNIWGELPSTQRQLLTTQYAMPDHRCSARQFATALGLKRHSVANRQYAFAAERFCKATGYKPDIREEGGPRWWGIWSYGFDLGNGRFDWVMHPELVEALEMLELVTPIDDRLPEEVPVPIGFREGSVLSINVNVYERNREARQRCIAIHGTICAICKLDFETAFGMEWSGLIHIHHLVPLADINQDYEVNPEKDLLPVCPNCHAMIHWRGCCRDIDYVRESVRRAGRENAPQTP